MKNSDVELIQQSLAGDQNAFANLVKKYQKSVHALAWRKIGDFHIAEEVTQDTFLQVYKKLGTLKDPHRFEGWLYRIASRQCHAWLRKKTDADAIVGRNGHRSDRKNALFPVHCRRAGESRNRSTAQYRPQIALTAPRK